VKHQYFSQGKADKDDLLLQHAVAQEWVPKGCLLEEWLVHDLRSGGIDPCAGCRGPREKCGGRPSDERVLKEQDEKLRSGGPKKIRWTGNTEAEARRMVRRQWIAEMTGRRAD